jgi:hypothetical protein
MGSRLAPLLLPVPQNQVSWLDTTTLAIWIKFVAAYDATVEVSMNEIYRVFKFCESPADYCRISVTVFGQIFVKVMHLLNMDAVRKCSSSKLWFIKFDTRRLDMYHKNKQNILGSPEVYLSKEEIEALRKSKKASLGTLVVRSATGQVFIRNKRTYPNVPFERNTRYKRVEILPETEKEKEKEKVVEILPETEKVNNSSQPSSSRLVRNPLEWDNASWEYLDNLNDDTNNWPTSLPVGNTAVTQSQAPIPPVAVPEVTIPPVAIPEVVIPPVVVPETI